MKKVEWRPDTNKIKTLPDPSLLKLNKTVNKNQSGSVLRPRNTTSQQMKFLTEYNIIIKLIVLTKRKNRINAIM